MFENNPGSFFISFHETNYPMFLDRLAAAVLLVLAAPLLILIALIVRIGSKGPVLVRLPFQTGDGRTLYLLSFRTQAVGSSNHVVNDFARFLGDSPLATLPRFFDVLAGRIVLFAPARSVDPLASRR